MILTNTNLKQNRALKLRDVNLSSSLKGKSLFKIVRKLFAYSFLGFFGISLALLLYLISSVAFYSFGFGNIDQLLSKSEGEGKEAVFLDRNGKEIYKMRGDVIKEEIKIDEVPDKVKWAFIAAEDKDFYKHEGLNYSGVARAIFCTVKDMEVASCGGGSSITQQLIKNVTNRDQKSITRKINEAALAVSMEKQLCKGKEKKECKDKILEYYLNIVPQGGNLIGVRTGSDYLFGEKDLNKLSLSQIAYLAAIPNQPSIMSPLGGTVYDQEKSRARAEYVLKSMAELGDLEEKGYTKEDIDKAIAELPNVTFEANTKVVENTKKAPHFIDYVLLQLDELYKDKVSENELGRDYIKGKNLTITTTIDIDVQQMLESTLKNEVDGASFQKTIGAKNAAAVMMDPRTGEVIAMVGSKDFYGAAGDKRFSPQANAAISKRSMGSTNKPVLYLSAFTQGYHPSSIVPDIPLDLSQSENDKDYNVRDYSGEFYSNNGLYTDRITGMKDFMTMRNALRWSLNVPAVSTYYLAGGSTYADIYAKLTGNSEIKSSFMVPSSPLGSANLRLIDQVHAYATLASQGKFYQEKSILEIKDERGKVIYDNRKKEGEQVIDQKYTYLINDMNKKYWLFDRSYGGDDLLVRLGNRVDIAGKTGTSDSGPNGEAGDVSFIGYTPNFVLGMWAGNSCSSYECPLTGTEPTGENLYKLLYKKFLLSYEPKIESGRFNNGQIPNGVKKVRICSETGYKADGNICPDGKVHEDLVADDSKLTPNSNLMSAWVVKCPDEYKLATQEQINEKFAEKRTYFNYEFPIKYIQNQINIYLKSKNYTAPPTEVCNLDLKKNNKPEIKITSPEDKEYKKKENLKAVIEVESESKIKELEILIDGRVLKSFDSDSNRYEASISLNELSSGRHQILVRAINEDDIEGSASAAFTVIDEGRQESPTPTPTQIIRKPEATTTPTPTSTPTPTPVMTENKGDL